MAASKVHASKVADSIKALMAAMDDTVLPTEAELRKKGWITSIDYAKVTGRSTATAKRMLDATPNIKKQRARTRFSSVMMYKA
jgi:hypothetical protein